VFVIKDPKLILIIIVNIPYNRYTFKDGYIHKSQGVTYISHKGSECKRLEVNDIFLF